MNRGFAAVVAVPAWAEFMRAATKGARPEWYAIPPGVEKVAICRLTGARATDACRHAVSPDIELAFADPTESSPRLDNHPEIGTSNEPPVYEDFFPVGAIPQTPCPLHSDIADTPAVPTPLVDSIIARPPPASSAVAIRPASARLFIERVPRGDGTYRIVIRDRQ
jgi:hypothetical protein